MQLSDYGGSGGEEYEDDGDDGHWKRLKYIDFLHGWLGGDERFMLLRGGDRALPSPFPFGPPSPPYIPFRGSRLAIYGFGAAPETRNILRVRDTVTWEAREYPAISGNIRRYPAISGDIRQYPAISAMRIIAGTVLRGSGDAGPWRGKAREHLKKYGRIVEEVRS